MKVRNPLRTTTPLPARKAMRELAGSQRTILDYGKRTPLAQGGANLVGNMLKKGR